MGSAIIVPTAAKGFASVQRGLGIDSYDLHELYGPDTAVWRSKVLDLGPVKYGPPNTSYWFDRSRYCNHGAITGAVWKQEPSGLWVLDFDGTDDYINCGNDTSLDFGTSDFTISCWVKIDVLGLANKDFFGKYQAATDTQIFRLQGSDATTATLRFVSVVANVTVLDAITTPTYTLNTWYKVTYTCDRDGSQYIYVNGVSQALGTDTQSSNGVTLTNTGELYWGVQGSLLTNDFDGKMVLQLVTKAFTSSAQEMVNFQRERHLFQV